MMQISEVGIFYDIFYIIEKYFDKKELVKLVELKEVPDAIKLFFYKGDKETTIIQQLVDERIEELLDVKGLKNVIKNFSDSKFIVERVLDFYFDDETKRYDKKDYDFVRAVNELILKSSYPNDVKNCLYCFFIEPEKVFYEVISVLKQLYHQVKTIYKNCTETVLKIEQKLNVDELFKKLNIVNHSDKIILAPCIINSEYLNVINNKNVTVLIMGEEFEKNFEKTEYDILSDFASVFSEVNRIRILNVLYRNKEMTIQEIKDTLKITATNAYYHLSLMLNACVIKTRNQGRTIIYSINKTGINEMCNKISKYCRE